MYGVDVPYSTSASNATVMQYYGWDRQPVTYSQIDQNMINAIVAIEDSRYWVHGALDLRGTIRAAVNDIQHQPVQGGSTIAQQYVKNVLLLSAEEAGDAAAEKAAYADTLSRKLNELRLAVGVEHKLHQAADPGRVPERRVLRQQRLRDRGRGRDLLRHHGGEADRDPGGHAGRHRGEPVEVRPDPGPQQRP